MRAIINRRFEPGGKFFEGVEIGDAETYADESRVPFGRHIGKWRVAIAAQIDGSLLLKVQQPVVQHELPRGIGFRMSEYHIFDVLDEHRSSPSLLVFVGTQPSRRQADVEPMLRAITDANMMVTSIMILVSDIEAFAYHNPGKPGLIAVTRLCRSGILLWAFREGRSRRRHNVRRGIRMDPSSSRRVARHRNAGQRPQQ